MNYEDLERRVQAIEVRAQKVVEKRNALKVAQEIRSNREQDYYNNNGKPSQRINNMETRNISQELLEKRAVTLSSTGTIVTDSELVRLVKNSHKVLNAVKFYYGKNGWVIPVQAAAPSAPSAQDDDLDDVSNSNDLALSTINLTPAEDIAGLAITDYNLQLSVITEAELLAIFAEAFGDKWEAAIQAELRKATNVADANKVTAAAAGHAAWADVIPMAARLKAKNGAFKLYMTPEQRMALEQERTTGYDFYAKELVERGTIKGLEVVELDVADATTAGGVLIFASDLSKNYAVGLAQDVMVEAIPSMKSGKQYKGSAFIDHKFIQKANNWCIIAHA